jgi:regulator of protease activity HflC (stomatin/prohibitin superfamily)
MARQVEAERERRAKIINAEGEFQAAQKIYDAAEILSRNPAALQLRYLQTLLELGGEKSTIVFPLPMDLIKPFLGASRQTDGEQAAPGGGPLHGGRRAGPAYQRLRTPCRKGERCR